MKKKIFVVIGRFVAWLMIQVIVGENLRFYLPSNLRANKYNYRRVQPLMSVIIRN